MQCVLVLLFVCLHMFTQEHNTSDGNYYAYSEWLPPPTSMFELEQHSKGLDLFSFFLRHGRHESTRKGFSEAACPAWTSWPAGDRILIWDPVWAGWNSTAIPTPTPTHRSSIKRSDPGEVRWGIREGERERGEKEREKERQRECAFVTEWKVDWKYLCICACESKCMPACLCIWRPLTGWLLLTASGWRFVTQSCSNGQSYVGSEAKWTEFKAGISHHVCLWTRHSGATTFAKRYE